MTYETAPAYLDALRHDPSLAILPLQMAADVRGVSRAAIDRMLQLGQLETIEITGTRYVRAASLADHQRGLDARVTKVRQHLEECAREGRLLLFYEPVMQLVGLTHTKPADRKTIGRILGDILKQVWQEHGVALTVIIHQKKSGQTRPGPGFWNLLGELKGLQPWDSEDALVLRETQRVAAFYVKQQA